MQHASDDGCKVVCWKWKVYQSCVVVFDNMVDHVSIIMLRLFDLIQSLQIHEDFVSSD